MCTCMQWTNSIIIITTKTCINKIIDFVLYHIGQTSGLGSPTSLESSTDSGFGNGTSYN